MVPHRSNLNTQEPTAFMRGLLRNDAAYSATFAVRASRLHAPHVMREIVDMMQARRSALKRRYCRLPPR